MSAARPAATVALVRDGAAGLEVFLVRRHDAVAFMGGAHVFPGGRVDDRDRIDGAAAVCDGVDAAVARLADAAPADAIGAYVAAVRELFEEAGVLLARDASGAMLHPDAAQRDRLAADRSVVESGRLTLSALASRERLRLALDALTPFAHWVTPEVETRRFDTRFFLAVAPEGQEPIHDDRETSHGAWFLADAAIDACRRGDIALPPPTWTTLRWLSQCADARAARRWAEASRMPRVQPGFILQPDGTRIVLLPGDPEMPAVPGFHASETRFLLADGRWRPIPPPDRARQPRTRTRRTRDHR